MYTSGYCLPIQAITPSVQTSSSSRQNLNPTLSLAIEYGAIGARGEHEDRHHLLSDLWRQWGGCNRTGAGISRAQPRSSFHFLCPADPLDRATPQHSLPRGRSFAISALRLSAL